MVAIRCSIGCHDRSRIKCRAVAAAAKTFDVRVPSEHDGSTAFTFRLRFGEEFPLSWQATAGAGRACQANTHKPDQEWVRMLRLMGVALGGPSRSNGLDGGEGSARPRTAAPAPIIGGPRIGGEEQGWAHWRDGCGSMPRQPPAEALDGGRPKVVKLGEEESLGRVL